MGDWNQFLEHYVNPMKQGQKRDCTDLQLAKVGCAHLNVLVAVSPYFLLAMMLKAYTTWLTPSDPGKTVKEC